MIPYCKVTSSWVDGFGFNSDTNTLFVGTKGKYYEVTMLSDGEIADLLKVVRLGGSVGSRVGKLFNTGTTVQVEWSVVFAAVGSEAPQEAPRASSKAKDALRNLVEYLLPQARTGLFSFNQ